MCIIKIALNIFSGLVGILATILIISGGIRYSMAGGDPNAVQKAKGLIGKGMTVVVGYGLLYALAQWLIPGGIL